MSSAEVAAILSRPQCVNMIQFSVFEGHAIGKSIAYYIGHPVKTIYCCEKNSAPNMIKLYTVQQRS